LCARPGLEPEDTGGSDGTGGKTSTGGKGGHTGGSAGSAADAAAGGEGGGDGGGPAGSGGGGAGGSDAGAATPADAASGMAMASAGCGKASPPTGAQMAGGGQLSGVHPARLRPDEAYPLGFAFHGYGRTNIHCRDDDCPTSRRPWETRPSWST
jgi:hypothetical protein